MKKIKFGLLPKIIVAIILGIALGTVSPDMPVRVFVTFNVTIQRICIANGSV